jgi:FkbM family methyltransferase
MGILNSIRRLANSFGVEAFRIGPATMWPSRLQALIELHRVSLVLDVGANDGEYAGSLIGHGYAGRIVSFEPLPEAWEALRQHAGRAAPGRWDVGPRVALGAAPGEVDFYEAGNSYSSSLLPMKQAHIDAAPESAPTRVHRIEVRRLDDILPGLLGNPDERVLLKIDVQGAERQVLDGALESLAGPVRMVQLEMSLVELYEGQPLAAEIDAWMQAQGFQLWDIIPGFRHPQTLQLMQYDGLYVRRDPA